MKASKPRSAKLSAAPQAAAPADALKTHFTQKGPALERERFERGGRVMARVEIEVSRGLVRVLPK